MKKDQNGNCFYLSPKVKMVSMDEQSTLCSSDLTTSMSVGNIFEDNGEEEW